MIVDASDAHRRRCADRIDGGDVLAAELEGRLGDAIRPDGARRMDAFGPELRMVCGAR